MDSGPLVADLDRTLEPEDRIRLFPRITHADVMAARGMSIKMEAPPNIEAIDKVFRGVGRECYIRGIFFCYGNVIYNPGRRDIPRELIAHEMVHSIQTEEIGGPEKWWDRYLTDKQWRFEQELNAHQVEYEDVLAQEANRHIRRRYIVGCAERLSGPLYGHMVTKAKAKSLIQGGTNGIGSQQNR